MTGRIQAGTTYTVQPGDTLSSIAQSAYNDSSQTAYMVIYNANKNIIGSNPNLIRAGQVLYIPAITAGPSVQIKPGTTYTVQSGDTLSSIALRAYGNSAEHYWHKIYKANKDVIGDDPNLIRAGEVLTIPVLSGDLSNNS
ncbi:MAG TPA: LysM peptidoglycan-binding domain-containing protein [Ktedonobacteraceae bacterium]|nr:LysM peptidoglycan-binding domain-containing protein [Ktedonobacteraceae bacterium]